MANAAVLSLLLKADDQISGVLGNVKNQVNGLGSTIANNHKAIGGAMLGIGGAITGFAALSVRASLDYSQSMAKVRAVTGATDEQFQTLQETAKALGASTQFTASEVASAMSYMGMAGMKTDTILQALPDTLNLAAAGALDMGSAANIVTNILAGFGMEAEDLSRATDVLSKTFTSSNTDLMMLGESMKYAAPVAKAFGITFEETSAIIGMFGNAGIQGSMAGSTLRQALVQLDKSAEEFGLTIYDTSGKMRPMADILADLEAKNLTASEAMELFQLRAGPGMMALLDQGSGALKQFTEDLKNSGGTAENIATVQMEGLHGEMVKLKSSFEAVQISVAEAIGPAVSSMADKFTGLFREVSKVPAPIVEVGVALGGVMTVGGTLLLMLPKLTAAFVTMKTTAAAAAATTSTAFKALAGLALTPAGLGVGAIGVGLGFAVVKGIDDLKKHRETVEENIVALEGMRAQYYNLGIADKAWAESLTDTAQRLVYTYEKTGEWESALEVAKQTLNDLQTAGVDNSRILGQWGNIIGGLEAEVGKYKDRLDAATDSTNDLAAATKKATDELQGKWDDFVHEIELSNATWDKMGFTAEAAMQQIADMSGFTMNELGDMFTFLGFQTDDFREHWREMAEAAGIDADRFGDALVDAMERAEDATKKTTKAIKDQYIELNAMGQAALGVSRMPEDWSQYNQPQGNTVNGLTVFGGLSNWGTVLQVPTFAHGGVVPGPIGSPQLAMVHGGESITPNGGMTVNVNVGTLMGDEVSIRHLVDEIQKELRRNQTVNYGAVTI